MEPLERQDLASSPWEGSASRPFSACGVLTTLPTEPRTRKVLAHGLSVQKLGPSWAKRMSWSPCCGPLLGEPGPGNNIAHPGMSLSKAQKAWLMNVTTWRSGPCLKFPLILPQTKPINTDTSQGFCPTEKCSLLSHVRLFVTAWNRLPFPPPGESSQPRALTRVSCIAGRFFPVWTTREEDQLNPEKVLDSYHVVLENPWVQKCLSALAADFIFRVICHGDIPISWFHTGPVHWPLLSQHCLFPWWHLSPHHLLPPIQRASLRIPVSAKPFPANPSPTVQTTAPAPTSPHLGFSP